MITGTHKSKTSTGIEHNECKSVCGTGHRKGYSGCFHIASRKWLHQRLPVCSKTLESVGIHRRGPLECHPAITFSMTSPTDIFALIVLNAWWCFIFVSASYHTCIKFPDIHLEWRLCFFLSISLDTSFKKAARLECWWWEMVRLFFEWGSIRCRLLCLFLALL